MLRSLSVTIYKPWYPNINWMFKKKKIIFTTFNPDIYKRTLPNQYI